MPMILLFFIFFIFLQIGSVPTITMKPTHDDCRHVTVTRFFGASTIVDAEVCGTETIDFNGQSLGGPTTTPAQ